jgi:hypothetical protein
MRRKRWRRLKRQFENQNGFENENQNENEISPPNESEMRQSAIGCLKSLKRPRRCSCGAMCSHWLPGESVCYSCVVDRRRCETKEEKSLFSNGGMAMVTKFESNSVRAKDMFLRGLRSACEYANKPLEIVSEDEKNVTFKGFDAMRFADIIVGNMREKLFNGEEIQLC